MPEYPHNARMLSQLERDMAVWRIESEAGAAEGTEDVGTLKGFVMALTDVKVRPSNGSQVRHCAEQRLQVYLMIFCNMMSQGQGSIANFFPSIGE